MVRLCTWAPTVLSGPAVVGGRSKTRTELTTAQLLAPVQRAEALGVDYLLVAQRWWGTGEEIEGSTYDCLAMTAWYAAQTKSIKLVTVIHPGFFLPGPIAKWGASIDAITGGRWAVNVTSGWHLREFGMFGADLVEHDDRYARSTEFIDILRGAWESDELTYSGRWYEVDGLRIEPRPAGPLEVFQGGQSPAAQNMAASHSDWMFLNGGPPEKIEAIATAVRDRCRRTGRTVRFALYSIPLVRDTDAEAWREVDAMVAAVDPDLVARRRETVSGAEGMWAPSADELAMLDSNEGFTSRLIGSPSTVTSRMHEFAEIGVDCFHVTLGDKLFCEQVIPAVR